MSRLQSRHTTQAMIASRPKTTALPDDRWTIHCGGIRETCRDEATANRQAHQWAQSMGDMVVVSLNSWPFCTVQPDSIPLSPEQTR